ncbi:protein translocase subunit SecD [Blastopirellula retiformator]|uniref:Multifunctional fusion protein n=1 Tax=Blastopirellula retiformator TaxID=2527970 RepID=A0A5C5V0W5_9BACT|nr:protein translocase subunit SecD [Blastopirellula retiformator]TWT31613.1 bifunctional preprotein translocase subunit SecD/SecF [Blastopirellula retiformator]
MRKYVAMTLALLLTAAAMAWGPAVNLDSWLGDLSLIADASAQEEALSSPDAPPIEVKVEDAATATSGTGGSALMTLAAVLAVLGLPIAAGIFLANSLRMPTYGWRLALIFVTIVVATTAVVRGWPPKFGIDLQGGVILIYEIDEDETKIYLAEQKKTDKDAGAAAADQDSSLAYNMNELIANLKNRVNPSGVREVVIRAYGSKQVEVIIPNAESADLAVIKDKITTAGMLEFMIVANANDHESLINRASEPKQQGERYVVSSTGRAEGKWVGVRKEDGVYQWDGFGSFTAAADGSPVLSSQGFLVRGGQATGQPLQILMKMEPKPLTGGYLTAARRTYDTNGGGLAVEFNLNSAGASLMSKLTRDNLPDGNRVRQLGIVMDDYIVSAPAVQGVIGDRGIITGRFTEADIEKLTGVLQAGKLPVVLRKEPISEQTISATLGDDTIRKGKWAIGISLALVLIFMIVYYHVAGVVACAAVLLNLVLILAAMILFNADLTLPGIAGLVLTVGMSVDANVLIYERIREELNHGASLRMALVNGFSKATTTIVDANLTTLITALVLYRIGTDQVRGFAVTLVLGIMMSMFTAIFCSRVFFDIAEKKRWLTMLTMLPTASGAKFDFLGKRKMAMAISLVLIVVGILAVGARGKTIFDIDFNGGSSVQVFLKEPMPIAKVREMVSEKLPDVSISAVTLEGKQNQIYKIDTSLTGLGKLGSLKVTDRAGKSATVDLSGADSLRDIATAISEAGTQISAELTPDRGGILIRDASNANDGTMSIESAGDLETAQRLNLKFAVDGPRYSTGDIPEGVEVVQAELEKIFRTESGESLLVMHNVSVSEVGAIDAKSTEPAPEATGSAVPKKPAADAQSIHRVRRTDLPADGMLALAQEGDEEKPEEPAKEEPAKEEPAKEEPTKEEPKPETPAEPATEEPKAETPAEPGMEEPAKEKPATEEPMAETPAPMTEAPVGDVPTEPQDPLEEPLIDGGAIIAPLQFQSTLSFDEKITAQTLQSLVLQASDELGMERPQIHLLRDGLAIPLDSSVSGTEWTVQLSGSKENATKIFDKIRSELTSTPVWPSSSNIGSQVAGDMQQMAVFALVLSLVGVVAYIWFRFQNLAFGLAAVVALVHDVLITLGALALTAWLQYVFGFLQIDEMKISLPVVAAFLTLIGYSLNDTIVVFDRIREVRGKSHDLTIDMVNVSINQTLGRTILTSLTTFIVVVILFFLGGEGVHSFSFALVVGIFVGTYSSIFVASPVLVWLMDREKKRGAAA